MNKELHEELKTALEKERATLVGELKAFAEPDPNIQGNWDTRFPQMGAQQTGSHATQEESADEVEEYETLLAAERTLESRLLEVTRALERMNTGAYGTCKTCKKEISEERMRANPAAEFDMEHSK